MEGRNQPWLINDLKAKFRDTKVKRAYQAKSQEKIKHDIITRMFDDFDALLPSAELEKFAVDFIRILPGIKKFTDETGEVAALEAPQIKLANQLLNEMIAVGMLELFDEQKNIRKELAELLSWGNLKSKADQAHLLCAFVTGVFEEIYVKYPDSLNERPDARQCAEKYINSHCRKIIIETLLQHHYLTESEANAAFSKNKQESIFKSPAVVAGITTGVAVTGLIALGLGLFLGLRPTPSNSPVADKQKKSGAEKLPEPS